MKRNARQTQCQECKILIPLSDYSVRHCQRKYCKSCARKVHAIKSKLFNQKKRQEKRFNEVKNENIRK
ncbi:MAG: hypothetical protein KAX49_14405 [Halanaerobiales bacterium]|nr:hypothetical protein [Halanaerobiales bacterium]